MIPLEILTYARHLDLPDIKNPASPHFSLPTKQEQSAPEIPTWRRWLVVLGAFLALFCSFGQLSSFGTYLSWYSHNQLGSYPLSTISWIGSLQLWAFFFSVSASAASDTIKCSKAFWPGGTRGAVLRPLWPTTITYHRCRNLRIKRDDD